MTTQTEALKLALDALTHVWSTTPDDDQMVDTAITAIKEALAQTEQEPVAMVEIHEFYENCAKLSLLQKLPKGTHNLYTTPPQRKPLTDEEIWKDDAIMAANSGYGATFETLRDIVRAIEAAHGIKGEA